MKHQAQIWSELVCCGQKPVLWGHGDLRLPNMFSLESKQTFVPNLKTLPQRNPQISWYYKWDEQMDFDFSIQLSYTETDTHCALRRAVSKDSRDKQHDVTELKQWDAECWVRKASPCVRELTSHIHGALQPSSSPFSLPLACNHGSKDKAAASLLIACLFSHPRATFLYSSSLHWSQATQHQLQSHFQRNQILTKRPEQL